MNEIKIGQKFGQLTVKERGADYIYPNRKKRLKRWLCKCDCGNTKIIKASEITRSKGLSCGQCGVNTYDLSGEYGIGYTTKGKLFYFDKEDYDKIKNYSWSLTKLGYLIAYEKGSDNEFVYLHRLILGLNKMDKFDVDHINHKVNDNRKENLRICTHQDNIMNSKLAKNNTSGVTGVRFETSFNKWIACIMLNYKTIHLGLYDDFDDAVKARKEAEEKYFGEYAYKEGDNI